MSSVKLRARKKHSRNAIIFYCVVVIPAVIHIAIFYFGVNLNSILLSFQSYDVQAGKFYFSGLASMKELFLEITAPWTGGMWWRSLLMWIITVITPFVSFFVSFFIYKKIPLAEFFKVILFLPSVLPGMAMILLYKNFTEIGIRPDIISNPATSFIMLIAYTLWIGFGSGMIMYCGIMARIDGELVDAMKVDGGTLMHEFVHLAWPAVYPFVTIGLYTGIIGIFTGSPSTYAFFGNNAPRETWTLGYYMYAKVVGQYGDSLYANYAVTSAANLMFGIAAMIPAFVLKRFFERCDPNY